MRLTREGDCFCSEADRESGEEKKDQLEGLTGQSEERRGEGNKIASEELIKDGKRAKRGSKRNKAGYTATQVACGWAGAVLEVTRSFGQEQ